MKRSAQRILTTHCGSLPRPAGLLDLMRGRSNGETVDLQLYGDCVRQAVNESVWLQVEHGVDVVTDGEQGKPGFFTYVSERLGGFEARPDAPSSNFSAELNAFPEYYEDYFARAMMGGAVARPVPLVCVGPVTYQGQDAIRADIENLKSAAPA